MEKDQSLIITVTLAALIIVSASIFIYVTYIDQPSPTNGTGDGIDDNPAGNQSSTDHDLVSLSLFYNGSMWNFTLSEIEQLQTITGTGRYIKTKLFPDVVLGDVYNYTGIQISTLVDQIPIALESYSISATARDNYTKDYSMNESSGIVDIYDMNGSILLNETAVMIIAFQENDTIYADHIEFDDIGPFRIAFIGENHTITSSGLWVKQVKSIEIHKES